MKACLTPNGSQKTVVKAQILHETILKMRSGKISSNFKPKQLGFERNLLTKPVSTNEYNESL